MDKKPVVDIVKEYKKAVLTIYKDAQVYLYGSYNNGTAHKDSDIDVAVNEPSPLYEDVMRTGMAI